MSFDPATALFDFGGKVLDKLFPDPTARAQAQIQLEQLKVSGQLQVLAAETELFKIDEQDRDSARQRQMALKDNTTPILAWIVILAAMALGGIIVGGYSSAVRDPQQAAMIGTVVGYVFNEAKQILAYYFGSSVSSRAKDETISKLSES